MAHTRYENGKMGEERLAVVEQANAICKEYADQGMVLTLRQLYYQFVARGLLGENSQKEYNRLQETCTRARMLGLMDWDYLIDRTRNLAAWKTYESPEKAMEEMAERYARDLWAPQKQRIEVWVEKDAAIGTIEGVCKANSVPYFSTRGYSSMSEMHDAAQRLRWHIEQGHQVRILHIGDHDPSGVDMSRDIADRLRQFIHVDWQGLHGDVVGTASGGAKSRGDYNRAMRRHMRENGSEIEDHEAPWSLKRIALNLDQIEQYSPPPNFAKTTDARFQRYFEETGLDQSWELDALDPNVLADLIQGEIDTVRNDAQWGRDERQQEQEREVLTGVGNWWSDVTAFIKEKGQAS